MSEKSYHINTESEYRLALESIEPYLKKGFAQLSVEEDEVLAQLTAQIEHYEATHYPMPSKPKTIQEMLELKMFERKMKQKDLAKFLEITENRLSEVLNGKRKVNIDLAKRLYQKLNIDPTFILEYA
jgi:HTH-type transcriptional regulator / antitoxin HigA